MLYFQSFSKEELPEGLEPPKETLEHFRALVHRFVPESPIKTPSRVDFVGAALLSGGLICLLVALTEGERWGWTSGRPPASSS